MTTGGPPHIGRQFRQQRGGRTVGSAHGVEVEGLETLDLLHAMGFGAFQGSLWKSVFDQVTLPFRSRVVHPCFRASEGQLLPQLLPFRQWRDRTSAIIRAALGSQPERRLGDPLRALSELGLTAPTARPTTYRFRRDGCASGC